MLKNERKTTAALVFGCNRDKIC